MKTRAENMIEKLAILSAIVVHQSVPSLCIERVVGVDRGRFIFQRILTPRPGPKVTHRDTWIPQQQQKSSSRNRNIQRVALIPGNQCNQVIEMKAGMREIQWLLIQPALGDRCYLKMSSHNLLGLIFASTALHKRKFTMINSTRTKSKASRKAPG